MKVINLHSILMLNTALKTLFIPDHAETSSWCQNWCVNETEQFVTSLQRLIGTEIK